MSFNLKDDILFASYRSSIEDIKSGKGLQPLYPPDVGSGVQKPNPNFIPVPSVKTPERNVMLYMYKKTFKKVKVYDISYDRNGYPLFLIYINGQWVRKSAKYFKPI